MAEGHGPNADPAAPPVASARVLAATRLLGTLRAGRLRVEHLAGESLDFAALARVLGADAADDPLIEEVRRIQEMVDTRLAVWRSLRSRGADAAARGAGAAEIRSRPEEDGGVAPDTGIDGWLGGTVAAEPAVAAPEQPPPAHPQEVPTLPEPAAAEPLVAAPEQPPPAHPQEVPTLPEPAAAEPLVAAPEEPVAAPEEPVAAPEDLVAAPEDGPGDPLDDAERTLEGGVVAAPLVPDEAAGDDGGPEEAVGAGDLPPGEGRADESQSATDLELSPVAEELDTLHDFDLDSSPVLDDDGLDDRSGAPPPRLAAWLTADEDDADEDGFDEDGFDEDGVDEDGVDEDGVDEDGFDEDGFDETGVDDRSGPSGDGVAAVAVPVPPGQTPAARAEDTGDEPTHDTGLGAPQAVSARLAPGLAGPPADDDEEVTGEMVARPPGRRDTDNVTNELAAAPAVDEFLFEEEVSSSTGLHVAFERPDEADEVDEEPDEDDGAPRLTDDEPLGGLAGFHDLDDELALEPVEAVDEDLYRQFLQQAEDAERRGDLAGAIVSYGDAIDLAPDRLEPLLGRGRAHLELGDYSAAMSDFQRAEDLAPGSAEPLVEMGNLYFARKEYRRAIEFYDQALELDGSLAMARCRRGICHHYRRNHRAAFQDLQKAYALDPDIPNIRKYVQMAVKAMERERRGR